MILLGWPNRIFAHHVGSSQRNFFQLVSRTSFSLTNLKFSSNGLVVSSLGRAVCFAIAVLAPAALAEASVGLVIVGGLTASPCELRRSRDCTSNGDGGVLGELVSNELDGVNDEGGEESSLECSCQTRKLQF